MKNIIKTLLGGAALVGLSAGWAMAADYTWNLSGVVFAYNLDVATEEVTLGDGGTAAGSITFSYDASGNLGVVNYNLQSTAGPGGEGTGWAVSYTNTGFGGLNGMTVDTSGPLDALTEINFLSDDGLYTLDLLFNSPTLMNGADGTVVTLSDGGTTESDEVTWRVSGVYELPPPSAARVAAAPLGLGAPGQLALVVETPEPASMALLGAGLLGLFYSRRRSPAA